MKRPRPVAPLRFPLDQIMELILKKMTVGKMTVMILPMALMAKEMAILPQTDRIERF